MLSTRNFVKFPYISGTSITPDYAVIVSHPTAVVARLMVTLVEMRVVVTTTVDMITSRLVVAVVNVMIVVEVV